MELRNDEDDIDVLVLLNEFGLKTEDKGEIVDIMTNQIGMSLDEKFGTVAFSGRLELLNNITEGVMQLIDEYQLNGRLFPVLKRDTIDREFKDRLLRLALFRRYWEVDEEQSVILTYDINYKDGRRSKRYYTLKKVGALKIFPSCYWIPERKMGFVANKFRQMVRESERNPNYDVNGNPVRYHFRIFRCYAIGNPEGLDRWRETQLKLFIDVVTSLYARTMGRFNYFQYVSHNYEFMDEEERERALRKVKKMRYWKKFAIDELKPYLGIHIQRLERMGIAHQEISVTQQFEIYDENGHSSREDVELTTNIERSLHQLTDALNELKESVYAFIEGLRQEREREREESEEEPEEVTQVSSDQFRI